MLYKLCSKERIGMEISFENKTVNIYREVHHQTKRVQESAESVVPDTDDDIGKLASVHTGVMLKSKDLTSRGVTVSGEATAALLYITEDQSKVSFVRLSKSFSLEYEIADIQPDTVAQVELSIINCEARVVNPRKVSVTFEMAGELSCFCQESLVTETSLPQDSGEGLHAKYDSCELMLVNAACEKTFGINEQFSFPSGKPAPSRLVSQNVEFLVSDKQLIGTKLIVKGNALVSLCYLSEEVNYPVKTEFSTPFSQIIDIGEEGMDNCSLNIELTSAYFDIINTISNDKALDCEIHAVIQLLTRRRRNISYVADIYSNRMPVNCDMQSCQFSMVSGIQKLKLSADERISVAEDCCDVLSAFVSLSDYSLEQGKLRAELGVDIVYRDANALLSSVHRVLSMEEEGERENMKICSARMADVYLRPDGQFIDGHISAEFECMVSDSVEFKKVGTVELDEESAFDTGEYPTVTLVKVQNESLWELAKTYHSSIEQIRAMNELEEDITGKLLLIPKAL